MEYKRKMTLMKDLHETKETKDKEYISVRVRKGGSGQIASTSMRDRLEGGGKKP